MAHAATLPTESPRRRVDLALGMVLFLGSWSMAFLTLFLSFLIIRHRQPEWPPPGVALPSLGLATAGTLVLLGSSVALGAALRRLRTGARGFGALWAAGLALALSFAAVQTRLWADLWSAGARPASGMYEGLFYMLTWFHAAHVACGLVGLLVVQAGVALGRVGTRPSAAVANVAVFWHFVDAVWLILFLGFFLT